MPIPPPAAHERSVPRSRVNSGDSSIDRRGRLRDAPPLLSYGFRPFFLFGASYAALAVPLWLWTFFGGSGPAGPLTGLAWHAHEMLFGYLGAVMAGFVLTAVPNWTGRLPISGLPLAAMILLWFIGRLSLLFHPEPLSTAFLDLLFPTMLAAAVWREILVGRNFGNLPIALLVSLFAFANGLDHAGALVPLLDGYGIRLALAVAALMIAIVGGRVTPSFTRNWMSRAGLAPLPAAMDRLDQTALMLTAGGLLGWVAAPDAFIVGTVLAGAGLLLLVRLFRWRGHRTLSEPIVLVLHLGYLWLAAAILLLGLSVLLPLSVPASSAIHALTAGAVGTMTLAVMTRASLGHTGRSIASDRSTGAIYALVTFGAVFRVAAPLLDSIYTPLLVAGGILWSAAFALFVVVYGPMLVSKRVAV
jgi:uncharacterized protein involved in response to NO